MQAVLDGAAQGGLFQQLPVRMIGWEGHGDDHFQLADAARVSIHVLAHFHRHAFQLNSFAFGHNAHDRAHAAGERRAYQVRGGEGLALSIVVHGGIRGKLGPGRLMNHGAVEAALVRRFSFYHDPILYKAPHHATHKH